MDTGTDDGRRVPLVPGYVLGRRLGRGGVGEVWLATDRATGDDVAVKIAPGGGTAGTAEDAAVLEREIALLRRMTHPHVVRLRRVVDLPGGGRAMVLDHARGGDLGALVARRGRLEPGEVTTLMVPLARALEHLHGRGLLHGDLSPGNVLFDREGRPMVADLGAARLLGTAADAWATPGFTAPASSPPDRDGDAPPVPPGSADIWSLGALAWFALTGAPPPAPLGSSVTVPLDAAGLPAGPASLTALIVSCLDPDPARRPSPGRWPTAPGTRCVRHRSACCSTTPPSPAGSGDRAVPAGPSGAGGSVAGGAGDDVTRRVRASAADSTGTPVPAADGGRRRWSRPATVLRPLSLLLVTGAALAAGAAVLNTQAWFPGSPRPASPPAVGSSDAASSDAGPAASSGSAASDSGPEGTPPVPARWPAVVQQLSVRRADALVKASPALLREVDAAGSPALAADLGLVGRLDRAGLRLDGLSFRVETVRVRQQDRSRAVVETTVTTSAHRQLRDDGTVVARVPATASTRVVLHLVPAAGGRDWRVSEVS